MSVYKVEGKCVRDQFRVAAFETQELQETGQCLAISEVRPGVDSMTWG